MMNNLSLNSIKGRILLSFGVFVILFAAVAFLTSRFIQEAALLEEIKSSLNQARSETLTLINKDVKLRTEEKSNPDLYEQEQFPPLAERSNQYFQLLTRINLLMVQKTMEELGLSGQVASINRSLMNYDSTQRLVVEKLIERGYKDYGLEGSMRESAHLLENYPDVISLSDVLTLRRHEKDYFLRFETTYIDQFNNEVSKTRSQLKSSSTRQMLVDSLLLAYQNDFNQIVALEEAISISSTGLISQINGYQTELDFS
jgi:hypothetical protein